MGEIAIIDCPCGFAQDELFIGVGMAGVRLAPVSCSTCGKLHVIATGSVFANRDEARPIAVRSAADGCPVCGSTVVEIAGAGGPCPRCGRSLRIETVGLWD